MAVTDNAAVTLASLQISISAEEIRNLGLVTNSVPYGTQIVISTIGAAIVVLIARFLGGRSA
jgi:uncharacterized membrane protein YeaQ/YmgE (transglycosylase-associated protein family)